MALPIQEDRKDAPCVNADRNVTESDTVFRANLNWKVTDTAMLYATWSEGFRPGGINRNPQVPDYVSDFLTNYELGWKSRWADDRLQFNGAVFLEDWDNIQVAFQGANGITQVENGPTAEILGTEMQLDWLATDNLRLSLAGGVLRFGIAGRVCQSPRGRFGSAGHSTASYRGFQG